MASSRLNPETLLMQSRAARECNSKAVKAELKAMYCQKAWRVQLSLQEYCKRFGIKGIV